jgi:hypothetical protein
MNSFQPISWLGDICAKKARDILMIIICEGTRLTGGTFNTYFNFHGLRLMIGALFPCLDILD